ncbi:hypothetical protein EDD22DRAFT_982466 [Suillus occidentalis]|nr:hypothetical protein EDD22DRAFT_982466 [Suillus occidentalis]
MTSSASVLCLMSKVMNRSSMMVILRSNKTMVSVATGANDYYPLYVSIRNVRNNVRRAHCDAVAIIGFLAMPKSKFHPFRKYCWQLFHSSLAKILENLRPSMTKPEIVRFGDGHYQCVSYGLGPYIADYEEQVLLACIVCLWCPRCMSHRDDLDAASLCRCHNHTEALIEEIDYSALWLEYGIVSDIHKLIAPDILHQLIKGTFKDHLVTWVGKIAAVTSFAGLQCFPEGRGFKQWTGDDSKVLMKVYLPAIQGHVPTDVVRAFRTFLEFCYLVWHNVITESTLVQIQEVLNWFHQYREIFKTTDTKHIEAVKEPWRCSSHYKALGQTLLTNQHLDKLAAVWVDFKSCGMLNGTCLSATLEKLKHKCACTLSELSTELAIPYLSILLRQFLFEQLHPNDQCSASEVPLTAFFNSACSTFYALSDDCSGIRGMWQEHIHACPVWRNEAPQYDCMFVNIDADTEGMGGMDVARAMCFFTFTFEGHPYPCAVMRWFNKANDQPDEDTGMWIVTPSFDMDDSLSVGIIHIDSIYCAAHLIPIYGPQNISCNLKHYNSYNVFQAFYVNKFTDHHVFEIAS